MKLRTSVMCGLVAMTAVALTSAPSRAGCTQDGSTVTCTGSDVSSVDYSQSDAVNEIIVEDLTDDVSGSGGSAITLFDTASDGSDDGDDGSNAFDATVSFDGTNGSGIFGITGSTDTSVTVTSTGGDGAEGETKSGRHETGGDGGDGGDAGTASLTLSGGFVSQTEGDTGIAVSSTGGAGGEGGEGSYTGNSFDDSDLYGGNGGVGGDGDTATLTISDLSNPDGSDGIDLSGIATGISVSSSGGAGGKGGEARCDAPDSTCKAYSGVGAAGGAAGDAVATITSTDITISDFTSTGIEISSNGGNGGQGGLAKAIYNNNKVENKPSNGYGAGGAGGDAGSATFNVIDGKITVSDDAGEAGFGVIVKSAGGDGGDGNDSYKGVYYSSGEDHPGWGNGGDGGSGGDATLKLTGTGLSVSLSADDAIGVLVTSSGGNAGSQGTTTSYYTDWNEDPDEGANGGDGGAAAAVSLTMDSASAIFLTGTGAGGSMGALTLLSQGGNGGDGGSGSDHQGDGTGGDGGTSDQVTGTLTTVEATTSGDDAFGIYLASLGGDGGTGKSADGAGAAGSTIDVSMSSATVTTTGDGSHGIYALSQGGAGGDTSNSGDGGDADWVKLTVSGGTVNVSGADAYGIAAVSSAGSAGSGSTGDTAGAVTLTVGADVTVSGSGSYGLYGESTGGTSNGTIGITVDSGATITASGDAKAAVYVVNGDSNTLINNGTITTDDLTSSSIYALKSSGTVTLDIINNGTFGGSVKLAHESTFANNSGATLNPGPTFYLGSSGTLTSDGTISPGGEGSAVMTTVTAGTFTQSGDGIYLVDIDSNSTNEFDGTSDLLYVAGGLDSALGGTVDVNVVSTSSSSGSSIIFYTNATGLDASGLTVTDTATTDYSLNTSDAFAVYLKWKVDMASSDILGSASGNQSKVASHLQSVLDSGNSSEASAETATAADALTGTSSADGTTGGGLGEELSSLLNIVSVDEYLAALDTFSPQVASDTQLTSLFSSQRFSDALLSCSVREGGYRFVDQDQCVWLRTGGSGMDRSASSANRPFEQRAWQFAGGGQIEVGPDWFLGTGFSIETQSLNVDGIADSDGTFYQGGVVAKHTIANSVLSASLTAGYGDFDITRSLFSGDTARGDESLWTVSGQVSASHAFVRNAWYVKPRIDLGFSHVSMNGFTETGAGGASLTIQDNEQTYVNLQPALEIGGEIRTANGALWRPKLSVGLTQYLGNAAPSTTASFADTPQGIAPFTTTSAFDRTYLDIGAGLEVLATDRITVSAQGFSQVSQNITSYGGSAKLAIRF